MPKSITRRAVLNGTANAGLLIAASSIAQAQSGWPNKPITIVVSLPAGGLTDAIARVLGQYVSDTTGQQVLIVNKPGASGNIAAAQIARAPADGYTFLFCLSSTLVQNRVMFKTLGFDPDKDFTIVSGMPAGPLPIVVHKSVPATNLKGLIEYARKNKVNFGSWALGSSAHVIAKSLNDKYGLSMEVVTYKGEAPMWQDMGAGLLQVAMGSPQAMNFLVAQGDIRGIVIPSKVRAKLFPAVSTAEEQGFTDDYYYGSGWFALVAPAATPKGIIKRMSELWVAAAESEAGKKMMESFDLIEKPMQHEEVTADYELLKKTAIPRILELGIKLD